MLKCQPATDVTKQALPLPRFGEQVLGVSYTRKLGNEAASKIGPIEFGQNSVPIDIARTWSQMLIPSAVIVVYFDHTQMLPQYSAKFRHPMIVKA